MIVALAVQFFFPWEEKGGPRVNIECFGCSLPVSILVKDILVVDSNLQSCAVVVIIVIIFCHLKEKYQKLEVTKFPSVNLYCLGLQFVSLLEPILLRLTQSRQQKKDGSIAVTLFFFLSILLCFNTILHVWIFQVVLVPNVNLLI